MATNAERLIAAMGPIFDAELATEAQTASEQVDRLERSLRTIAAESLVTVMAGDETFRTEKVGMGGFVEAWRDWLAPYERYRIEPEEMIDRGDRVVIMVRQHGTPRGGGHEIEQPSAAVWFFRDDALVRVEFHLAREAALRAAGIEE